MFPPTDDADSLPDDLTQLFIHLTGSDGTPYSSGLWLLHLRIPPDYPKSPPKATFKTRIFHPNVEESTGAVCLETLKRDWDPKLTLKDILVTISCLLIQPNPDSALNEKAGVLVREDYDGFVRQAKLMTKIHAPIPLSLRKGVEEAQKRGDENAPGTIVGKARSTSSNTVVLSKLSQKAMKSTVIEISSSDEGVDSTKENEPAVASVRVQCQVSSVKKPVLGKRPLTELIGAGEGESDTISLQSSGLPQNKDGQPPRKSPKHTYHSQVNGRELSPSTLEVDGAHPPLLDLSEHVPSTLLHTGTSKQPKKSKYRPYARVGIKRL